ncbi:MAG: ribosome small subunit-dependent GTPase A [Verrucomicrobia bacterium]|nr:ribosome small subunit-dependent GTPase A [Verrucomicrobiota bacterium]MDA1007358.1 ribosome small subunit-dependent GTPase A [Verrucomicrobiota bacterium]
MRLASGREAVHGGVTLEDLGWNEDLAAEFTRHAKRGLVPGRVIGETKINYGVLLEGGDVLDCVLAGKLWHDAGCDADLPAVGDWVGLDLGGKQDEVVIRERLARRTRFSRKMPGKSSEEQVIAANVDLVVVVTDAGEDFSPRRMERYLMLIEKSGAKPVVLVNKADLYPPEQSAEAAEVIRGLSDTVEVHVTSAVESEGLEGLEVLRGYLQPGVSLTLVGSSGVGKSTLVNQLLGEEWQWTGEVNEVTGKGRHTTTARELIVLPEGGILIDNPGVREVQMWTDEHTLRESFTDVEALGGLCKFADCKHQEDAGCAIRSAVEEGRLDAARYDSYLRLEEEIEELNFRRKKRQMSTERWAKRNRKVKARNFEDRVEMDREERGEF